MGNKQSTLRDQRRNTNQKQVSDGLNNDVPMRIQPPSEAAPSILSSSSVIQSSGKSTLPSQKAQVPSTNPVNESEGQPLQEKPSSICLSHSTVNHSHSGPCTECSTTQVSLVDVSSVVADPVTDADGNIAVLNVSNDLSHPRDIDTNTPEDDIDMSDPSAFSTKGLPFSHFKVLIEKWGGKEQLKAKQFTTHNVNEAFIKPMTFESKLSLCAQYVVNSKNGKGSADTDNLVQEAKWFVSH
ncbi:hypothetical protein HDU79_000541, partial [Rhizoclosmatium sp. JEL0117]